MKWRAFRVASRQIIEDMGDYVIVLENLEPDQAGPLLIREDDREITWVIREVIEPKPLS
jgi:hypothetical protein